MIIRDSFTLKYGGLSYRVQVLLTPDIIGREGLALFEPFELSKRIKNQDESQFTDPYCPLSVIKNEMKKSQL